MLLALIPTALGYAASPRLGMGHHAISAARWPAAARFAAMASDDDAEPLFDVDALKAASTPVLLGGRIVEMGDGLLVNDDASGAWWRASVQDTRPGQVLVHYTGCDPEWDEWMDVDSPKISRMDEVEQKKDERAFQSDSVEDDIDDEELLAQMRSKRWDDNARWQLNVFAQAHLGEWAGSLELYSADEAGRMQLVDDLESATCSCDSRVCASNTIELAEALPSGAAALMHCKELGLESFRPEVGNMAVASAFSLVRGGLADGTAAGTEGDELLIELALGEKERRVRCKLLYVPDAAGGEGAMRVASVGIVREVRGGGEFIDANAGSGDIDGTPGRGLYDPPPAVDKSLYISL